MSSYTKQNVLTAIKKVFPKIDSKEVENILNLYGERSHEKEQERVKLAILKLSEGNFEELVYYKNIAKSDYRDVLYWAEYKNDQPIEDPYINLIK